MIKVYQYTSKIVASWQEVPLKLHLFSGGETHVTLNPDDIKNHQIWVEAHIGSMVDMGYLLVILDAIQTARPFSLGLYIPYFPGARQDHPEPGTPATLAIYVDMLNRYKFREVVVVDPHSPVLQALLVCDIITPGQILSMTPRSYNGIICPDAGAEKRATEVAKALGIEKMYTARKVREQLTGKITKFSIDRIADMGRYLVVDDICDGGATFNMLADAVREGAWANGPILDLYVTHGIFSKGFTELQRNFEKIITTNSFPMIGSYPRSVEVIDITPIARAIMEQHL